MLGASWLGDLASDKPGVCAFKAWGARSCPVVVLSRNGWSPTIVLFANGEFAEGAGKEDCGLGSSVAFATAHQDSI